jgi:hypothetical protein
MRIDLALPEFSAEMTGDIRDAVHTFFHRRAQMESRDLRALLRRGRTALLIGRVFLSSCVVLSDVVSPLLHATGVKGVVTQGLTVAGWVAMWRPLEIFLYSWWPIRRDRRLDERHEVEVLWPAA